MPKKFLTVNEVAKIFGVTPLTVRNWDKKGQLTAHRNPVNNYRLYLVNEVEELMKKIETSKGNGSVKIKSEKNIETGFRKIRIEES